MEKINKLKSWFFEKINKTDNEITKIRNESRVIPTHLIEIERIMRVL